MSNRIQLHIYDLSDGIARQLSLLLTGRQIDGVWHTSIVVYGKEVFYGRGITIAEPGTSIYGEPLQIIDMGETGLDEETFQDFVANMREKYTAEKYHLLDFNCNSFTNDVLDFLNGSTLPTYIKALPDDFLSTPFGQALRPTIDAMFEGRKPTYPLPPRPEPSADMDISAPDPTVATGLLQSVAQQATVDVPSNDALPAPPPPAPAPAPAIVPAVPLVPIAPSQPMPAPAAPVTTSVYVVTNPTAFQGLLRSNRAVVVFFTSATCGPCRMIEPAFEELAETKGRPSGGIAFAKIDLSVGMGGAVAAEYQVRATPTFVFFLKGKQTGRLQGANAPELKTQVNLLIYEAFPPHAHTSLSMPAIEAISLNPILFDQIPPLDKLFAKLAEFINGVSSWVGPVSQEQVTKTLFETVLPFLKTASAVRPPNAPVFDVWPDMTLSLAMNLPTSALYPVVDIWRLGFLNSAFAAWNATKNMSEGPIQCLINKALEVKDLPRNYLLTVLRMLANTLSNKTLARNVIVSLRDGMTTLLVDALLYDDVTVRTAAASLAFNIAVYLQRQRIDKLNAQDDTPIPEESEDWEVEIVTAVLGAIEREMTGEDAVHRLVACLALMLRLSPYLDQLAELLEALQAKEVLTAKLGPDGFGDPGEAATTGIRSAGTPGGIAKKEVRKLISEVAEKLCPT